MSPSLASGGLSSHVTGYNSISNLAWSNILNIERGYIMNIYIKRALWCAVATFGFLANVALAGDITPKMQTKIDTYKKQSAVWAADPAIVKAVKDANTQGPISGMGNAKWRELKESDPTVSGFITNATGQLLTKWMNADAKGINKIVLSGNKSHRVAYTSMPAKYIGKGAPNFDEPIEGKLWHQGESKPDPSTDIDSVQIAAPVKDGKEVIGVLLISLTAANLK
jgi:hypothetical protein